MKVPTRSTSQANYDRARFVQLYSRAKVRETPQGQELLLPDVEIEKDTVIINGDTTSKEVSSTLARRVGEFAALDAATGTLPTQVATTVLKAIWTGSEVPNAGSFVENEPGLHKRLKARGFVNEQETRVQNILDRFENTQTPISAPVKVLFNRNGIGSGDLVAPAAASGDTILLDGIRGTHWLGQNDNVLAFMLAHEEAHINHGDSWEREANRVLLSSLDYESLEEDDNKTMLNLARSIKNSCYTSEVEADFVGLERIEQAGFDRRPVLAWLKNLPESPEHPAGEIRVNILRDALKGSDREISEDEMKQIHEQAEKWKYHFSPNPLVSNLSLLSGTVLGRFLQTLGLPIGDPLSQTMFNHN